MLYDLDTEKFDNRTREAEYKCYPIIDRNSGEIVGYVEGKGPGRIISLFGGKYRRHVSSHAACYAFIKAVETVLNCVTSTEKKTA